MFFREVGQLSMIGVRIISTTVDDINPALPQGPKLWEYMGMFLIIMGNAGFASSTVVPHCPYASTRSWGWSSNHKRYRGSIRV